MPRNNTSAGSRLVEIDALRGLAALAVVLFHYTTRYVELYGGSATPSLAAPQGHYGVNLFFIISGFVIFLTLARTARPMDFVVSRFSRLFPAYWVAVVVTFGVTRAWGLAGKEVTALQGLANLTMVHNLAGIPHVDGVYWTLEVELIFYAGMLALFAKGALHRVHLALWVLLLLKAAYHFAGVFGIEFSWTLSRLLNLQYIPWFALGICIYQATSGTAAASLSAAGLTCALSLACLGVVNGWPQGLLALCMAGLVWGAAAGHLPWLKHRVLAYFGAISYSLYLLHENIGWVLMRELQQRGISFDASIAAALALSLALASAITYWVEKPAMAAIRDWYRRRAVTSAR